MKSLAGLRIAAYARYSSDLQNEGSIEAQFLLLRRYVEANGGTWDEVETFSDAAESGASMDRPGVQRLLRRVHGKKKDFDVILVESIDRLSRTVSDTARLCDELDFADVRLIAVSESIDTADPNARLTLHIKASLAQQFLKELGDKTRRGLHGRAAKGFSTGGLPYGYKSQRKLDGRGKKSEGSVIEIDEPAAVIVRRIYGLWIAGHSYLDIAGILNADGVPTPRKSTKERGWIDTTVRAVLNNAAYIGKWTFGSRRWLKVPGTKKRRYRDVPEEQVQHFDRPELRILDDSIWKEAQTRINAVAGKFRGKKDAAPVRKTSYPLSGILYCGGCSGPMSIIGGSSARYYRCIDSHKRKTCPICQPLREDQITEAVLSLVRTQLSDPVAHAYLAEMLRRRASAQRRDRSEEAKPLKAALAQVTRKVDNLVASIASGELSGGALGPVQKALEAAEAERKKLDARLHALETQGQHSGALPTPEDLTQRAQSLIDNLDTLLRKDATEAREQLRKYFHGGKIFMYPVEGGGWRAETRFYPTILLSRPTNQSGPGGKSGAVYSSGCAGRI